MHEHSPSNLYLLAASRSKTLPCHFTARFTWNYVALCFAPRDGRAGVQDTRAADCGFCMSIRTPHELAPVFCVAFSTVSSDVRLAYSQPLHTYRPARVGAYQTRYETPIR
jgi:hypothetical protein